MAALSRLPQKQRAAVVLHHSAGYPAKEVAAIIGSLDVVLGEIDR